MKKKIKRIFKLLGVHKVYHFAKRSFYRVRYFVRRASSGISRKIDYSKFLSGYRFNNFRLARESVYPLKSADITHVYESGLVSIVVPVYNYASMVGQTIDSILSQTYSNFELIVVDDGSTDNTLDVVEGYAKRDERVRIISQKNQKLPAALSNGFAAARGEYYMWLGGDDVLESDYLEKIVGEFSEDPSVDFIYVNARIVDEKNQPVTNLYWYNENPRHQNYVIFPDNPDNLNVVRDNYILSAMYRSVVVKTIGAFSENRFTTEDYDYWMKINDIFNVKHSKYKDPLFVYRRHSGSLTANSKELEIVRKTEELMMYEDFRRDYLLLPFVWFIATDKPKSRDYTKLVAALEKHGRAIESIDRISEQTTPYKYQVCVFVGSDKQSQDEFVAKVPAGTYKALYAPDQGPASSGFDLCVTSGLADKPGWFGIGEAEHAASFVALKSKLAYLSDIEDDIEAPPHYALELSIIICADKYSDRLRETIASVVDQGCLRENYEIILVNGVSDDQKVRDFVLEMRKEYKLSASFLRVINSPARGLSFAHNIGLFAARGKVCLWLDDNTALLPDTAENIIATYKRYPAAGIVRGQIIPRGTDVSDCGSCWGGLKIKGEDTRVAKRPSELDCGGVISGKTDAMKKVGGFRCSYGRSEYDFSGSANTVASILVQRLGKEIILAPNVKAYYDIDASLCTARGAEKIERERLLASLQMELDLYRSPELFRRRNIKRFVERSQISCSKAAEDGKLYKELEKRVAKHKKAIAAYAKSKTS